jgi:hypothetical protein
MPSLTGDPVTTLREVVATIDLGDEEHTIYAVPEWMPDSPAMEAREPDAGGVPAEAAALGMDYFPRDLDREACARGSCTPRPRRAHRACDQVRRFRRVTDWWADIVATLLDIVGWPRTVDRAELSMRTICLREPWGRDAEARVVRLDEDWLLPPGALDNGFTYFREATVADEVLAVLRSRAATSSDDDACRLLVHYAERRVPGAGVRMMACRVPTNRQGR